jgi:hypothetical protein
VIDAACVAVGVRSKTNRAVFPHRRKVETRKGEKLDDLDWTPMGPRYFNLALGESGNYHIISTSSLDQEIFSSSRLQIASRSLASNFIWKIAIGLFLMMWRGIQAGCIMTSRVVERVNRDAGVLLRFHESRRRLLFTPQVSTERYRKYNF